MKRKKRRSIFQVLIFPHILVLLGEIILMLSVLISSGMLHQLSQNMEDIFHGQVENRHAYLLNEMVRNWSDLDTLSKEVNQCVESYFDEHEITLSQLCQDSQHYTPVLNEVSSLLIDAMYANQLSGTFLILAPPDNAHTTSLGLPGLYFRDRDPQAMPSHVLEDILVQRAPHGVIQAGRLTSDTDWTPLFTPEDSLFMDFFQPYHAALADGARLEAKKYGYWTSEPYILSGDNLTAISYSIPLISQHGTVYGILGVELLTEYVSTLIPSSELHSSDTGSYMIAVSKGSNPLLQPVVLSDNVPNWKASLTSDHEIQVFSPDNISYHACALPLTIYSRNAPFSSEQWYLMGCVPEEHIYGFSDHLTMLFMITAVITLLFGILGTLLVSYRLSRPIRKLSQRVIYLQKEQKIASLPDINIQEIDQLVDAVTTANHEVMNASTRFLSILDMASVELAGFDIWHNSDSFFVSDNYFSLLGRNDINPKTLTHDEFLFFRTQVTQNLEYTQEPDGSILYTVKTPDNGVRYIRAEHTQLQNRLIGLIEDVTSSVQERKKAESERDYDPLSGLLSRQGFSRNIKQILTRSPDELKVSALLMLDLDKLKTVNDTFGHSAGDAYIIAAGVCLQQNTPDNALCARVAGDEFLIFYHSYDSKEQIRTMVTHLSNQIRQATFLLPDGSNYGISASGGLTWYPDDSSDLSELMRYADFAMYGSKKQERGKVSEFNFNAYHEMLLQTQCQNEFFQLLEQELVEYHFQPIFHAKTGKPFAYEALMRTTTPNLRSPLMVLELARKSKRLPEIEALTFFHATESFEELLREKQIEPDALLFINSIADTCMSLDREACYQERFLSILPRLVIEITETELLDLDMVNQKRDANRLSGMLALDDYGSGYNTELNLLELNPSFIKVDMAIIRDIHLDENKQHLVRNIVAYAHERGMYIIAEGLECASEVEACLLLGVDFLQGYFLSRPAKIPSVISSEAQSLIQTWHREQEETQANTQR